MVTLASDVQRDIEKGLEYLPSVTDMDMFLEKIHPIEETVINSIFERLEEANLYSNGRWKNMPVNIKLEQELYCASRIIADAINAIVTTENCGSRVLYKGVGSTAAAKRRYTMISLPSFDSIWLLFPV
ncbi:hypothetical protein M422DRAFT_53113 [Sphaerobolus stellatus SS14]|uniref:Uncharacterized protein n=1 Tax=Sphaerobolus stellatus (strain SS14) TaxID=990650 RepID=A0A0C9V375_SPHS4|nr:hypothetical protein M422DRAFT_53113 [Sphaerobolus stellatus SS14]